jgi:hypothetical protein
MQKLKVMDFHGHVAKSLLACEHGRGTNKKLEVVTTIDMYFVEPSTQFVVTNHGEGQPFLTLKNAIEHYNSIG